MDLVTNPPSQHLGYVNQTLGIAHAIEYATTARAERLVRHLTTLAFSCVAFLAVWGTAGLLGQLAGMQ
jgi:hypothetical protein